MAKNINISILITNSDDIITVDSLKQQTFNNFECFLMNNSIEQINKYIKNDERFHVTDSSDINHVIEQANGKYIIIANANSVFIPTTIEYIERTIFLTDADIINFNAKILNLQNIPKHRKPNFNYICSKKKILEHVFDDLSCFCIKKELLQGLHDFSVKHLVVFDMLKNTKNITDTQQTYVLLQETEKIDYKKAIDNFVKNEKDLSVQFWKNYFKHLVPKIMTDTIKNNDKDTFVYCCKKIPLKLIPLKYKFAFLIMRIIN